MSATMVIPDVVKASRALLRGEATYVLPPVAANVAELRTYYITSPGWIDTFIPDPAQLPRNAIKISAAGGGLPRGFGRKHRRVQFDCYGDTKANALRIATLVEWIFTPLQRNMQGFTAENTRIVQTLAVLGPYPDVEPNSDPTAHFGRVIVDLEMLEQGVA